MAATFTDQDNQLTSALKLPLQQCTMSLWVRSTVLANAALFECTHEVGFDRELCLNDDGRVSFRLWRNPGSTILVSTATCTAGQWSHVLVSHGPGLGGLRLVVDGDSVEDLTQSQSYFEAQSLIVIGGGHYYTPGGANQGPTTLEGDIAEFAIWDAELTPSEETLLRSGGSPLLLTHRIADLLTYQDLIGVLNRPGIGPAVAADVAPAFTSHPPRLSPAGAGLRTMRYPRRPGPYETESATVWADASDYSIMFCPGASAGQAKSSGGGH